MVNAAILFFFYLFFISFVSSDVEIVPGKSECRKKHANNTEEKLRSLFSIRKIRKKKNYIKKKIIKNKDGGMRCV